jgi:hypothetical protein
MVNIKKMFREFCWKYLNIEVNKIYPRGATRIAMNKFKDKPLIVCEIGAAKGEHADRSIMRNLNVSRLYIIDNYVEELHRYDKAEMIKRMNKHQPTSSLFPDKVKFIFKDSLKAYRDIPMCDFIYIDGNHDYEYVSKDIENYWKKVKVGGMLAGHDIDFTSVFKAVSEFAVKNNLLVYCWGKDWTISKTNLSH